MKKCPYCAEEIQDEAIKCRHCNSMLDGSGQGVTVTGVDPFAGYHTPIQGKKRGRITFIGYLGIGLGALMIVVAVAALVQGVATPPESIFFIMLLGIGFTAASYLWARK